jgi:hypothetical protein
VLASASYDAAVWRDFYVMVGAAAATLTGLVFVGLSIHRRAIVASPFLLARARYLTGGLTGVLLTSALLLVPSQSDHLLGAELIVAVFAFWMLFYVPVVRLLRAHASVERQVLVRIGIAATGSALWVATGISLLVRSGGGLYLLVPGVIVATVVNVAGAWSILMGTESDA